jgi:channel protein (hemolysin III family)
MRAPWILFAIGGAIYIAGALIYVFRIPERFKPGKFDLCGASHQIFHFAVIIACCLHYYCNVTIFQDRQSFQCPVWPNFANDSKAFQLY